MGKREKKKAVVVARRAGEILLPYLATIGSEHPIHEEKKKKKRSIQFNN